MNDLARNPPGDHRIRATAVGGAVRALAIRSTHTVAEALRIHGLSPVGTAALGRLLTGALFLSADLKNATDSVTVQVRGDGPLGGMTVVAEPDGTVRGTVRNPVVDLPVTPRGKLDVGGAVGAGTLTVIKDLGLKEPYVGQVDLRSGEIAEDLAYYYAASEQTPTVLGLGVLVDASGVRQAGGYLVQLMPEAGDDVAAWLEERVLHFPEVTWLLEQDLGPSHILDLLLGDPDIRYHAAEPVSYRCPCSRERMERNLIALGREELRKLADDPEGIRLECHFCDRRYRFRQAEVRSLLANPAPGGESHAQEEA